MKKSIGKYEESNRRLDSVSNKLNHLKEMLEKSEPAYLDVAQMLEEFSGLRDEFNKVHQGKFGEGDSKQDKSEANLAKAMTMTITIGEKTQNIFMSLCEIYCDVAGKYFAFTMCNGSLDAAAKKENLKSVGSLYKEIADSLVAKGLQGQDMALLACTKSYVTSKLGGISKKQTLKLKERLVKRYDQAGWWGAHCSYFLSQDKFRNAKNFLKSELSKCVNQADKFALYLLLVQVGMEEVSSARLKIVEDKNLKNLSDCIKHLKKSYEIFQSDAELTNLYCLYILRDLPRVLQAFSKTLSDLALHNQVSNVSVFSAYIAVETIQLDISIKMLRVDDIKIHTIKHASSRLLQAAKKLFTVHDHQPFTIGVNDLAIIEASGIDAVALKEIIEKVLDYCRCETGKRIDVDDPILRAYVMSVYEESYRLFMVYQKVFAVGEKVIFDLIFNHRDVFGPFIMNFYQELEKFQSEEELGISDENRLDEEQAFFIYNYVRVLLHNFKTKYKSARKNIIMRIEARVNNLREKISQAQYQRILKDMRFALLKGKVGSDSLPCLSKAKSLADKIEGVAKDGIQAKRLLKSIKPENVLAGINEILQTLNCLLKKNDLNDVSFNAQFNSAYFYCLQSALIYAFFLEKNEADGFGRLKEVLSFGKWLFQSHKQKKKDLAREIRRKIDEVIIPTWPTGGLELIKFEVKINKALNQVTDLLFLFGLMGVSPVIEAQPQVTRSLDSICAGLGRNVTTGNNNNGGKKSEKKKRGKKKRRRRRGRNGFNPKPVVTVAHVENDESNKGKGKEKTDSGLGIVVQTKHGLFSIPRFDTVALKQESQKDFTSHMHDIVAKFQVAEEQYDKLLILFQGVDDQLSLNETMVFLKLLLLARKELTEEKTFDLDFANLDINGVALDLQIKTMEASKPFSAETDQQKTILERVVPHLTSAAFREVLHAQRNDLFKKKLERLRSIKRYRGFVKAASSCNQYRRVSSMVWTPYWFGWRPPAQVRELSVYKEYKSKGKGLN